MRAIMICLCVAGLAGCVRPVSLAYTPPAYPVMADRPLIGRILVADERGRTPAFVGAVMAPDGKPLKTLAVDPDAAHVVVEAFRRALAARNEFTRDGSGPYELQVEILTLDGQQWATRQAEVDLALRLVDRRTGREVYDTRAYAERRSGNYPSNYLSNYLAEDNQFLGSPWALARVEARTLASAIDRALDRTGFVLAMR